MILKAEKMVSCLFLLGYLKCGILTNCSSSGTTGEYRRNLVDGPIKIVVHYVLLQYYRCNVHLMILAHDFFFRISDISPCRIFSVNFERAYEFSHGL